MKYLFLLLPITVCLSACAGSPAGTETKSTAAYIIPEKIESGISDALQEETTDDEAGQASFGLPVNTTAESVEMHWDGERLSRASVCIGDKLYFSQRAGEGRQSCLYETTIGGTSLVPCGIEIPEGMDVHAITRDDEGDLHLLLRTPFENSGALTSIIRKTDAKGEAVKEIDVSVALGRNYAAWQAFFTDAEGNYYLTDLSYIICMNPEGAIRWEKDYQSLGIERSFAAADVGGKLYIAYQKSESTWIGELNPSDGALQAEYPLMGMEGTDAVLAVGQGTDTTLLLYAGGSGVWAWDSSNNSLECRTEYTESALPYSETILLRRFLSDGRCLLVKNISDGDQLEGITFQYLPGGKEM